MPTEAFVLPDGAREVLTRFGEFACIHLRSTEGIVLVIKAPTEELPPPGRLAVGFTMNVYQTTWGPVLQLVSVLYDRPDQPLKLEVFFNIGDPVQRQDLWDLSRQAELLVVCYDEQLNHRGGKRCSLTGGESFGHAAQTAERLLAETPPGLVDFNTAKRYVLAQYPL